MKAIVIGASSGGPKALEKVLKALPGSLPAVIIIAQHLPSQFTGQMAESLKNIVPIPVSQIENGEVLKPSHIYIIPGNFHFFITEGYSSLITSPDYKAHLLTATGLEHPSIDMGFTSIAEHFGPDTIGVVLTGMGEDGVIGAKAIKQLGGKVIVQDEKTSAIFGMPRAVQIAGFADEVLPLEGIAGRLVELVQS